MRLGWHVTERDLWEADSFKEFQLDSLFGPPFLIGSCLLIGMCAMTVAGKVEISKTDDQLKVLRELALSAGQETSYGLASHLYERIMAGACSTLIDRHRS
jgi:hypothetical protein